MRLYEDPNNLILDAKSKLKPVVNNASKPSKTSISNEASGDESDRKAYTSTMKSEHEGNEDRVASDSFTKVSNVVEELEVPNTEPIHFDVDVTKPLIMMKSEHEGNEDHVASDSFTKVSNVVEELEVPSTEPIHFDADVTKPLMHDRGSSHKVQSISKPENNARFKCTVPQPFIFATDKRASRGCKFPAASISNNDKKHTNMNNIESPNLVKKSQVSLHLEFRTPQPKFTKHIVEEDVWSVKSLSTASVKAFKSRTTIASAPIFRVSERAEKWIQFYSKLEEKQATIEAERIKHEARKRDEDEAALKELRRSMNFKATPMPSFYHEGPPPKAELKKIPVTRPKSPKFSRRRSRAEANFTSHANHDTKIHDRTNHHSFDSEKNSKKSRFNIKNSTESCGAEAANDQSEPEQIYL